MATKEQTDSFFARTSLRSLEVVHLMVNAQICAWLDPSFRCGATGFELYRWGCDVSCMQVALAALKLANAVVADNAAALEAACLLGLVPAVTRYCFSAWPTPLRAQAANFVHALCYTSLATARMFVACQVTSHTSIAADLSCPVHGMVFYPNRSSALRSRSLWSSSPHLLYAFQCSRHVLRPRGLLACIHSPDG